jgi:hypothetical protein
VLSLVGPRPTPPRAPHDSFQFRLTHATLSEILSNRAKNFVERLIRQKILLNQQTHVLRRSFPGTLGLSRNRL